MERLALLRGDPDLLGRARRTLASSLARKGEDDEAQKLLQQVEEDGRSTGDCGAEVQAALATAELLFSRRDLDGAFNVLSDCLATCTRSKDGRGAGEAAVGLGVINMVIGAGQEAHAYFTKALELAEYCRAWDTQVRAHLNMGRLMTVVGDIGQARACLVKASEIAKGHALGGLEEEINAGLVPLMELILRSRFGADRRDTVLGPPEDRLKHWLGSVRIGTGAYSAPSSSAKEKGPASRARRLAQEGSVEEALSVCRTAEDEARTAQDYPTRISVLEAWAIIEYRRGNRDKACSVIQDAYSSAERYGLTSELHRLWETLKDIHNGTL